MKKFEFKRLRIFRILGCIGLTVIIILAIRTVSIAPQTNQQIFQTNLIVENKLTEEEIANMASQNIPIPEDIKLKMIQKAEEKRIAKEKAKAEAEQKAKEEAEKKAQEEALRVAKANAQKVTSRSGTTSRATSGTKAEYQNYAHNLCINTYGWTEYDFECLVKLWNRESGWNANAHNSSSGAHGIPQSLPASKMASEGDDYYTNGETQIRWGLKYILNRYGSPSNAWAHSQSKGWY